MLRRHTRGLFVNTILKFLIVMSTVSLLVGCDDWRGDSSPAVKPNSAPAANAGAARTLLVGATVLLDGSASSDPENDALTFTWSLTTKPAGSAASLTGANTAKPSISADVGGTYVATLTVSDGKLSSAPATVTITVQPIDTLKINVDKIEPLSGSVQFSLPDSAAGSPVIWYVDLNQIGTGASASWNTTTAANATHLVLARIQVSAATTVEVRRPVTVSNSSITLSSKVSGSTGTILVDIRASSPHGIGSVSATFDGMPAGSLTAPNACSRDCTDANDVYRYTVDAAKAGSGKHTMLITATDGAGGSQQVTIEVPVANTPTLIVSAPVDGGFAYGSLNLSGSYATDKSGLVTITASLGDVQFLSTTEQTFSGSYDLTSVAPGAYVLTVKATDSTDSVTTLQRTVTVTSSGALTYSPLMSLGAAGQLMAAEGDRILYTAEDQSLRLRDTATGNEVTLQGGAIAHANDWQISGGRVYVFGQGNDCELNYVCVYQWDAAGTRKNLTTGNPWAGASPQQHPVARSGYVIWCNGGGSGGSYTVYDVAADAYSQVSMPVGMNYVGNTNYDLTVVGGVLNFIYWGQTGGDGAQSTFDVFRWTSDTTTSTRLSTTGLRSIYPRTDGVRVAWSQAPVGSSNGASSLQVQSLVDGATITASTTMNNFVLRDGVVAWVESTASSRRLKASTVNTTTTLSILNSSTLYDTGGGFVVFGELGKTYSWNAAQGKSTLRLEASPERVLLSGSAMYFVMGNTQTLYKLELN